MLRERCLGSDVLITSQADQRECGLTWNISYQVAINFQPKARKKNLAEIKN
jgi:hypothetical protein